MENKKMTKKDYFKALLEMESVSANTDLVAFINHELELLEKKASSNTKSKTQVENEGIKKDILNILKETANQMSITDIQNYSEDMKQYSNQKISALLKQLVDENLVERIVDKKKTLFVIKSV